MFLSFWWLLKIWFWPLRFLIWPLENLPEESMTLGNEKLLRALITGYKPPAKKQKTSDKEKQTAYESKRERTFQSLWQNTYTWIEYMKSSLFLDSLLLHWTPWFFKLGVRWTPCLEKLVSNAGCICWKKSRIIKVSRLHTCWQK